MKVKIISAYFHIYFHMSDNVVRIRVRLGTNEAEIEAPFSNLKEVIHLVSEVVQHLPQTASIPQKFPEDLVERQMYEAPSSTISKPLTLPEIKVEKDDSLPNVIVKLFQEGWGRQSHKLNDIRNVLESYGLIYPKQSVAVAILRLAKEGKLRRFKDESGEFVYTSSSSLSTKIVSENVNSHSCDSPAEKGDSY